MAARRGETLVELMIELSVVPVLILAIFAVHEMTGLAIGWSSLIGLPVGLFVWLLPLFFIAMMARTSGPRRPPKDS